MAEELSDLERYNIAKMVVSGQSKASSPEGYQRALDDYNAYRERMGYTSSPETVEAASFPDEGVLQGEDEQEAPEFSRPPAVEAAEGAPAPFRYREPTPEMAMNALAAIRTDDPKEMETFEEMYRSIEEMGEKSPYFDQYKEWAWSEVYDAFADKGLAAIREDVYGPPGGDLLKDPGETAAHLGSTIGIPFLMGADAMMTFGAGTEALATVKPVLEDERVQEVLDDLQGRGVIPDFRGRLEQSAEAQPFAQVAGGLGGLLATRGIGLPGMAAKAIGKRVAGKLGSKIGLKPALASAAAAQGLARMSPAARWAAQGAAGAAAFGSGTRAVGQLGQMARGEREGFSPEEAVEGVGSEALVGGALGFGLGGVAAGAKKMMSRSRSGGFGNKVGLTHMEEAGAKTSLRRLGIKPPPADAAYRTRKTAAEVETGRAQSLEPLIARDLAKVGVSIGKADEIATIERQGIEIAEAVKRLDPNKTPIVPKNTWNRAWDFFDEGIDTIHARSDVLKGARGSMTGVMVVNKGNVPWELRRVKAAHGDGRTYSLDQAREAGLGRKVKEALHSEGLENANEAYLSTIVYPKPQKGLEGMERSMSALDDEARWSQKTGDPVSKRWREMAASLRKDRESASQEFADLKHKHHLELIPIEQVSHAMTGQPSWRSEFYGQTKAAINAIRGMTRGGDDREVIRDYFKRHPKYAKQLADWEGWTMWRGAKGGMEGMKPGFSAVFTALRAGARRGPYMLDAAMRKAARIDPKMTPGITPVIDDQGNPDTPDFVKQMGPEAEEIWAGMMEQAWIEAQKRKKRK